MSQDWQADIQEFHKVVMQDSFKPYPHLPTEDLKKLRKKLILEEILETIEAIDDDNLVKIADGICDSIVVLLGTAVTYGINVKPVWDEIHKSNMAKKDGKFRADGKKLKPDGWQPPNIGKILDMQANDYWRDQAKLEAQKEQKVAKTRKKES